MIPEQHLIGWLVITRYQLENDTIAKLPNAVLVELVKRGWLECDPEPDWEGLRSSGLTAAGASVSDLAAPEWGIDPIPQEETNGS